MDAGGQLHTSATYSPLERDLALKTHSVVMEGGDSEALYLYWISYKDYYDSGLSSQVWG
jgi:hypothetical protein